MILIPGCINYLIGVNFDASHQEIDLHHGHSETQDEARLLPKS